MECYKQLVRVIETERSKKGADFIEKFKDVSAEHIQEMTLEDYLFVFGSSTSGIRAFI